ncbi:MAG TPA: transporter [Pantanalinema sp.]
MRRWAIALASVLAVAMPADAYVINLNSDYMPDPGHVELLSYGSYSPYTLKVLGGAIYSANPEGSAYHWLEAWNSLEVGLVADTSMTIIAPYDLSQSFDGAERQSGLGDLTLALGRKLWSNELGSFKTRLKASFPVGPLGAGVAAVGVDTIFSQQLIQDVLSATLNLNYGYNLQQTVADAETLLPRTSWQGHGLAFGVGLDYALTPSIGLVLEALGQFDGHSEADRRPEPESGATTLTLAPGLSWSLSDAVCLQASLQLPLLRGGYQDSYPYGGMAGVCLDF